MNNINKTTKNGKLFWYIALFLYFLSFLMFVYTIWGRKEDFSEAPSWLSFTFMGTFLIGSISLLIGAVKYVSMRVFQKGFNFLRLIKLFLSLAIFPIYLIINTVKSFFKNHPKKLDNRYFIILSTLLVLCPIWFVVYVSGYYVATDEIFLGTRYQIATMNEMNSMAPSFPGGSIHKYYPYKNIFYKLGKPYQFQRGDTIAFSTEITRAALTKTNTPNYFFWKRIIALPGDTVEIKGGAVFVNDKYAEEPYTMEPNSTFSFPGKYQWSKDNNLDGLFLEECQKVTVPEHKLFVLGDNRKNSDDSRTFGFVDFNDVSEYLPLSDQKVTYYEGVTPVNHSDKWRTGSDLTKEVLQKAQQSCIPKTM